MDSNSSKKGLLLLAAVLLASAGVLQAQDLVVKNNDMTLPPMFEDEVSTNYFVVSNASGQPVEITGVRPTCGCTFARAETNIVQPRGLVRILFGYHANRSPGSVSKKILLSYGSEQVYLGFTANVRSQFTFDRYNIDFHELDRAGTTTVSTQIVISAESSCTNVSADSFAYPGANMKVTWSWDGEKRAVTVKIDIDTTKYTGPTLRDGFSFNLNCNGNSRQYYVPIFATFK